MLLQTAELWDPAGTDLREAIRDLIAGTGALDNQVGRAKTSTDQPFGVLKGTERQGRATVEVAAWTRALSKANSLSATLFRTARSRHLRQRLRRAGTYREVEAR